MDWIQIRWDGMECLRLRRCGVNKRGHGAATERCSGRTAGALFFFFGQAHRLRGDHRGIGALEGLQFLGKCAEGDCVTTTMVSERRAVLETATQGLMAGPQSRCPERT